MMHGHHRVGLVVILSLLGGTAAVAAQPHSVNEGWVDDGTVVRLATDTDVVGIGTRTPAGKLEVTGGNAIFEGNVGIGTTSPQVPLHVKASTTGHLLKLENTDASNSAAIELNSQARTWLVQSLGPGGDQSGHFRIYDLAGNAPRLSIDTSGNVGIGTTSPQAPLHVKASTGGHLLKLENTDVWSAALELTSNARTWLVQSLGSSDSAAGSLRIYDLTANAPRLLIDPNGDVAVYGSIVAAKGPWVDVRAYGAKGDGVTDDTAAIQNAIAAIGNNDGTLLIPATPAGIYLVSDTLLLDKRMTVILNATLKLANNTNRDLIQIGGGYPYQYITIIGGILDGNKANNTAGNGITNKPGVYIHRLRLLDMEIKNFKNSGINLTSPYLPWFFRLEIHDNDDHGIYIYNNLDRGKSERLDVHSNGKNGFFIDGGGGWADIGSAVLANGEDGYKWVTSECQIIGSRAQDNSAANLGVYRNIEINRYNNIIAGVKLNTEYNPPWPAYDIYELPGPTPNVYVGNLFIGSRLGVYLQDAGSLEHWEGNRAYVYAYGVYQKRTNSGTISIRNGSSFPHGLLFTPTSYQVTSTIANRMIGVTGVNATNIDVTVTDENGSAVTTPFNANWRASVGE